MSKLSTCVKYNNWNELENNISAISAHNFTTLLVWSVKYHSKECFDILIGLPNAREWINKRQRGIKQIFINYEQAPNKSNEYYVDKVLPILAYFSSYNIYYVVTNSLLLDKIFERMIKNEHTIKDLLHNIIETANIEQFLKIFGYMKMNQTMYPFFTNQWIQTHIITTALIFDNVDIIIHLDQLNLNLITDYLNINNYPVSILVLALVNKKRSYWNYYNMKKKKTNSKCFEYLIDKKISSNQNLIWSVFIYDSISSNFIEYYELENDWNFDFSTINNEIYNNVLIDFNQSLSKENLSLKFIEIYIDGNNDENNDENIHENIDVNNDENDQPNQFIEIYDDHNWENIITVIEYLFEYSKNNNHLKNIIKNILDVPNLNFVKNFTLSILNMVAYIELTGNHRSRRKVWRNKRNKNYLNKIVQTLNILKYIEENKLSNHNPFDFIKIDKKFKNLKILKDIMLFISKIYPITDDINNNILSKIFTKTELKSFTNTIGKISFDNILKNVKSSTKKISDTKKKATKKVKPIKPIKPINPINPIVNNNHINYQSDSEDSASTENELEV